MKDENNYQSNRSLKRKMLHTMLRVGDLQRSIDFYTKVLGMKVLRTLEQPDEEYTLCFVGYGDESNNSVIELTYNYGVNKYDVGTGFGHIAIGVENCEQACNDVKLLGGNVSMEATPLSGTNEVIAFVLDPDGYQVEMIQR